MLILATSSPRRKQLLKSIGWDFLSIAPEIDEEVIEGESPEEFTMRMARAKSQAALGSRWTIGDFILAADTAVIDPGLGRNSRADRNQMILGKPTTADEAKEMLTRLRGRTHQVCTSITILDPVGGTIREATELSTVKMRYYTIDEINEYISSCDPFDKAGGYAIQHPTFQPVQKVTGCYPNVVGLPVCQVMRFAVEFGHNQNLNEMESCSKSDIPCWIYRRAFQGGIVD